jgi:dihydrolipoamide dehydrogenase
MSYDLGIIGGGPAGYVAAERAAQKGLKVVLFDQRKLGGVCLNEGCIPSKTLLYSAKLYDNAKESAKYGINIPEVSFDFSKIMARKNKVVTKLVAGIGAAMKKFGVEVISTHASIRGRKADGIDIEADSNIYSCKNILVATGSEAFIPPIKGLDREKIFTNRELLDIQELPQSITIIGGGVIGMEFASFFSSMGTKVTVIEMLPEILPGLDSDLSAFLLKEFTKKGVVFHLNSKVTEIKDKEVIFEKDGKPESVTSEIVFVGVGRKPVVTGFGLDKLGVEVERGGIKIDKNCRTNIPNVYAAGDVTGFSMLAHTASREGEVTVNHILGNKDTMRYNAVPSVVYTNPEISCVGISEQEAKKSGIGYKVRSLQMVFAGRFVAENEGKTGICKIIVGEKYEEVLGVHMIGNPSSEMIYGAAMAIENQMRLKDLEQLIFPHPTVSEIFRETIFSFHE